MEEKEIITGRNPVFEYLSAAGRPDGIELHISRTAHGKIIDQILAVCSKKNIRVIKQDKSYFREKGSSSVTQGVILLTPPMTWESDSSPVIRKTAENRGLIVLLDRITDPHNMGSIIRSAEALGCGAVVIPKSNSAGINSTVVKASSGATAHIEILSVPNVSQFLDELKKNGFWIIGASADGDTSPEKASGIRPACLVIGSEGSGMRRLTEEKCDYIVSIPLKGNIRSLNASVAAGILIYEMMKPSKISV